MTRKSARGRRGGAGVGGEAAEGEGDDKADSTTTAAARRAFCASLRVNRAGPTRHVRGVGVGPMSTARITAVRRARPRAKARAETARDADELPPRRCLHLRAVIQPLPSRYSAAQTLPSRHQAPGPFPIRPLITIENKCDRFCHLMRTYVFLSE